MQPKRILKTWLFLFLFAGLNSIGFAQVGLTVYDNNKAVNITKCEIYKDSTGLLQIEQISNLQTFQLLQTKTINLGVDKANFWIKFTVQNTTTDNRLQLEIPYPILDEVHLYKMVHGMLIDSFQAGENYSFQQRPVQSKNFVFPLHLDSGQIATYFLKVNSGEQIILPLFILSEEELHNKNLKDNLFNGIYFGIILVMMLYNLFVFFSIREASYIYYVIYIFSVGITQAILNGYAFRYLWPNSPWIAQHATMFGGAFSGLTTIFFVRNFLQTKMYSPRFDKMLTFFAAVYAISLVFCFTGHLQWSYNLININAGPGSFILLFTAINIYRKYKSRPSLFFIISWSIFLLSVIVFVLKDFGIIPYNAITISGLQIGSAVEVTLLSFALADKINIFRKEKEISQAEALKAAMENERIIREQNITLEIKVNERTTELQQSNSNLNIALDDLKQAQTQLVEQEKMASLGQLTAGIAHEINNPINFVSSNVKPLKRDVEIIIDLMNKIETIGMKEISKEEKTKEIETLKKDFDFNYLMEEIHFLLKGINEGSSRTAEIVKGLRLFSRVDEDDIKLANIHDGLDSTLIIVNNTLNNKILIVKEYADEIPKIECYPGKLNQVFLNILSNSVYAIKAKFNENPGGQITLKTEVKEDKIQISLSDNGTGMDETTQRKLFEPFFTTKPVGEGTGLGLSIVFNTINKHNGKIKVESQFNEGTTFTITLPIKQTIS